MTTWEVIGGGVTAVPGSFVRCAPYGSQSYTVRNSKPALPVELRGMWAQSSSLSIVRLRSPRMHDNVQNLRFNNPGGQSYNLLQVAFGTPLIPQDNLIAEISDGIAETDALYLYLAYQDLPGSDGRFANWRSITPFIVNLTAVEVDFIGATTSNNWAVGQLINSTEDLLKANCNYAILGYEVSVPCGAIGIYGSDTSGLIIGGPGTTDTQQTRDWFIKADSNSDISGIPVLDSANKYNTYITVGHTGSSYTGNVTLILAELSTAPIFV